MSKTRDVRQAVEAELRLDPVLDSSGIMVENLGGDVTLDGTVASYPQYLQAAATARRAAGVHSVHNNLEIVLPPGDKRDDPVLTTAANNALALNRTVPDTVEAEARHGNGCVTLTGSVRYGSQRTAAEATVATLPGVRGVRSKIEVEYDTEPGDVTRLVPRALAAAALVPGGSEVKAATAGNTVTLTGHVRTAAEHDAVVDATWTATGVQAVIDEIHVTG